MHLASTNTKGIEHKGWKQQRLRRVLLLKLKYREGVEHKGWKQQRLRRVLLLKLKYREGVEHKGWKQQRLRLVLLQGRDHSAVCKTI